MKKLLYLLFLLPSLASAINYCPKMLHCATNSLSSCNPTPSPMFDYSIIVYPEAKIEPGIYIFFGAEGSYDNTDLRPMECRYVILNSQLPVISLITNKRAGRFIKDNKWVKSISRRWRCDFNSLNADINNCPIIP